MLLKQIAKAEIINNDNMAQTASPALEIPASAGRRSLRMTACEEVIVGSAGEAVSVGFFPYICGSTPFL